jgi:fatty acid desaturase
MGWTDGLEGQHYALAIAGVALVTLILAIGCASGWFFATVLLVLIAAAITGAALLIYREGIFPHDG